MGHPRLPDYPASSEAGLWLQHIAGQIDTVIGLLGGEPTAPPSTTDPAPVPVPVELVEPKEPAAPRRTRTRAGKPAA